MSDRKQSIPQPDPQVWQELAPFREAFLRYLTVPEDAAAVRKVGDLIFEMVLDYCRCWPQPEETETVAELQAITRDLRYAEHQLRRNVAESLHAAQLGERERDLARQANCWADRLASLTGQIEQAIVT